MKPLWKLWAVLIAALLLCACVPQETTDIVSFCANTKTAQSPALRLTDCLIERENGELRYFWSFLNGIALRVICTGQGDVAECRVLLQRLDADGGVLPVTQARADAFCALASRVCSALEEASPQEIESLFGTLRLPDALMDTTGTSEVFRGKQFAAVLVQNGAESVLRVCNRWLTPLEEKETPESRPAFDETTNIRTETVPLS